jgi:hypothetical protein
VQFLEALQQSSVGDVCIAVGDMCIATKLLKALQLLLEALQLSRQDTQKRVSPVQQSAGGRGAAWVSSHELECCGLQRGKQEQQLALGACSLRGEVT